MGRTMPLKDWSDRIILAELQDDPQFTDDLNTLQETVQERGGADVVLDFSNVHFLNSSNIAKLLKLRKLLHTAAPGKLRLCGLKTEVWGVFLVTGLDKIFECCNDVSSALASVQIEA